MQEPVFQGSGPFALPAAQDATADGGSNGVEMTLYCLIDGSRQPVLVQMTLQVARELSGRLMRAAADAEIARSKS